jgi:DNA-binding HxlR family transcriptional regulator
MGASYHQFCPVAKAMELLDERWTMLVVRELLAGSRHFNDLRRGLPRMSPTLLSKRLQQLVAAGVVERRPSGAEVQYLLTPAGRELEPIVRACDSDPGYDVSVVVTAALRCLVDIWLGSRRWSDGLRSGEVAIEGPEALRRSVPAWFKLSAFASVPRPG